jgi:endonuclease YncB( thermonuclease family)
MAFLFLLSAVPFVSAEEYVVKSIKTGDRLELTSGKTVRLIGIDVPESPSLSGFDDQG